MAITFVAAGTGGAGLGAVTPTMPAGATTDDILILVIVGAGEDANADAPPTGGAWNTVGSVASRTDGVQVATRCSVYWAWYDAAINLTVPDAGDHTLARVYAFRGVDTADPFDVASASGASDVLATVHSAVTGQTSVTAGAVSVLAYSHGDGITYQAVGGANTQFDSWASGGDIYTEFGTDSYLNLLYGTMSTARAVGTWEWGSHAVEDNAWWAMVLRPIPDGGGGGLTLMGVG